MLGDIGEPHLIGPVSGEVAQHQIVMDRRSRPAAVAACFLLAEYAEPVVVMADPPGGSISHRLPAGFSLIRQQTLQQRRHVTLDDLSRRMAAGEITNLNLVVKADVGGSVEALSDALLKLSNSEVAVAIELWVTG